jgi:DtxR family Mn-dependent transcriptional regulator
LTTEATENILATIYRLTCDSSYASTKDIAASLGVSMPTVSEKIGRLSEQGLVDHKWRKGVALTPKGLREALQVLRKHRLIEAFLVEVLNFSLHEVNEEACRLEHAATDRFIDALDDMLGHPKLDPHGHPIPSKEGTVDELSYKSLADTPSGSTVLVKQVNDQNRDHLHYLQGLGIIPGAEIIVLDVSPFEGPLSLDIDGKNVAVARALARKVGVASKCEVMVNNGDNLE